MINSKKITLFLRDGLPKGLRESKIDQWSGKAIACPRIKLKDLTLLIKDACCVYFLISEPSESELIDIYVGEADGFSNRIKNHDKKDWWTEVVVFVDDSLTKTSVKYLEYLAIKKLLETGRSNLINSVTPTAPTLLDEDKAGMLNFFNNISLLMPILGYDIFGYEDETMAMESKETSKFVCQGKGAKAYGILLKDGKMKVLKDSLSVAENAPAFKNHNYMKLKDSLISKGRLIKKNGILIFTDDYIFNSPSAAAAVVLGRSASGPKEWKSEKGKRLETFL